MQTVYYIENGEIKQTEVPTLKLSTSPYRVIVREKQAVYAKLRRAEKRQDQLKRKCQNLSIELEKLKNIPIANLGKTIHYD